MNRAQREWDLLQRIGIVRVSGTTAEKQTAEQLRREIEEIGEKARLEMFEVQDQVVEQVRCTTKNHSYEVTAYGCGGVTEETGLSAGFYYMEYPDAVAKQKARGKIVLVNGYLNYKSYKAIVESGAVGFITFSGEARDTYADTDLIHREMRPQLAALGKLPGVHMRIQDAMALVKENPDQITLTVRQKETTAVSQNVIAEIKGSVCPEEVIILTAHYDSVETSTGVYDNGAGSVILMELLRQAHEHRPRRTLRFLWCGSEERGLLGSHAYVDTHPEELKKILLDINVDVAGPVLGHDTAWIIGPQALSELVSTHARHEGFCLEVKREVYSSDEVPFADQGIPSIGFTRFGERGAAYIHCRHDTLQFMSAESLDQTTEIVQSFLNLLDSAEVFPIDRTLPEDQVEAVHRYLNKETKA